MNEEPPSRVDVCIVTPRLDDNSLGRTYCLWLMCRDLGLTTGLISPAPKSPIWSPLAGTEFAAACDSIDARGPGGRERLSDALTQARAVLVVKAVPESFGLVYPVLKHLNNVLIDIDDPDLEAATSWLSGRDKRQAMTNRNLRYWHMVLGRRRVRRYPVIVSNPVLAAMYGGTLVPHVRETSARGAEHVSANPRVAFVGSAKPHKGIEVLRAAVDRLSSTGYSLEITAPAPADARAHERWLGVTSLERGQQVVRDADIIAIPSLDEPYARAQFPVKIIDAQYAARPIVASEIGPIPWAIGDGGILTPPGQVDALATALLSLQDPQRRRTIGDAGRLEAEHRFSVAAVTPVFAEALKQVLREG